MINLKATHGGATFTTEHVTPDTVAAAHEIAEEWAAQLRREFAGEHVILESSPDGFVLEVMTKRGDPAVLKISSMLAALPWHLHGAGVHWGAPG